MKMQLENLWALILASIASAINSPYAEQDIGIKSSGAENSTKFSSIV
jgi:hypothetical protein